MATLVMALAACGDDGGTSADTAPMSSAAMSTSAAPSPAPSPTPTPTPEPELRDLHVAIVLGYGGPGDPAVTEVQALLRAQLEHALTILG